MARKAVVAKGNTDVLAGGLEELESVIAAGAKGVLDAGRALRRIRNERLYQGGGEGTWDTFDAYCRLRWDMVREVADRMIRHADVADCLLENDRVLPRSAQALTILAPVLRAKGSDGVLAVWDKACDFFGGPGHVSFAGLEEVVKSDALIAVESATEPAEADDVVDGTSEVISEEPEPGGKPVADEEDWEERIREAIEEGASEPDSTGEEADAADSAELSGTLARLTGALTAWSDMGRKVRQLAGDAEGLLEELGGIESAGGKALEELISSITEATEETLDSLRDVLEDAEDLPSPVPPGAKPIEEFKDDELDDDGFPVPATIFSHGE